MKKVYPFAKTTGGNYHNPSVSVSDKAVDGFRYLGIASDANLQLVPKPKTER
jgi:hypothetical protein